MSRSVKILRTPLISAGNGIHLKPECLQPFGSYKLRGITSVLATTPESKLRRGITAASAGNMAQPVAYLAREFGYPCTIYVPDSAPEIKKAAIARFGAKLVELPFAQVWEKVCNGDPRDDGLFIHPVFTPGLLEGYSNIAHEILQDAPDTEAVVVPFGVGGLTLGIARGLKRAGSKPHVYACEPETAAPYHASVMAGRPVDIERIPSFVDAIGTPEVLPQVFAEARELSVRSVCVTLKEVTTVMRILFNDYKLVCEGAGAAAVAGALALTNERNVTAILTGGNISLARLAELIRTP